MSVEIRREAHLERHAVLDHVLEQRAVLPQARAVPDPPGATIVQGLPDRVRAVSFARVTGARYVVLRRVGERPCMVTRREAPLGSSEVEPDDARGAVLHRGTRQLE